MFYLVEAVGTFAHADAVLHLLDPTRTGGYRSHRPVTPHWFWSHLHFGVNGTALIPKSILSLSVPQLDSAKKAASFSADKGTMWRFSVPAQGGDQVGTALVILLGQGCGQGWGESCLFLITIRRQVACCVSICEADWPR